MSPSLPPAAAHRQLSLPVVMERRAPRAQQRRLARYHLHPLLGAAGKEVAQLGKQAALGIRNDGSLGDLERSRLYEEHIFRCICSGQGKEFFFYHSINQSVSDVWRKSC